MFDTNKIKESDLLLSRKILNKMYPNSTFEDKTREEKAIKDIEWMLLFVIEAYDAKNERIIVNLINWFKELFKGLDIEEYHADLLFEKTVEVLHEEFHDKSLDTFLSNISFEEFLYDFMESNNPYKTEQKLYLKYLLNSDRTNAHKLIMDLVNEGVSIEDIYLYVFQETMREVGMLWQTGKIQVGREHYCTAVTQYLMSSLYSYIFQPRRSDKKILACAVGSELHEIGIRMVADFFEMNGWDTSYLGPNLPREQIISFAKEFQPNVIALSVTMPYHISVLRITIEAIKQDQDLKDIKILVGGIPFLDNKDLYKYVGADAVAMNAKQGIEVANKLLQ
jgi:methanogenic corrinoid protein MtbC1